ncbi:MAG: hypothetical protein M3P18_19090 [Actinomycetota bacterium]|nr:hypothetical protein [Actinomycetota bacterium]
MNRGKKIALAALLAAFVAVPLTQADASGCGTDLCIYWGRASLGNPTDWSTHKLLDSDYHFGWRDAIRVTSNFPSRAYVWCHAFVSAKARLVWSDNDTGDWHTNYWTVNVRKRDSVRVPARGTARMGLSKIWYPNFADQPTGYVDDVLFPDGETWGEAVKYGVGTIKIIGTHISKPSCSAEA